ncbi:MAG: O-antigen ligase family protein [Patescibacteria group bacterium]|nr:O-antigen ligase family protein [Patescibacteria group bacterium]
MEKIFILLVFLTPLGLYKKFLLPTSYVKGVLDSYLVPKTYLTDTVLAILVILFWLNLILKRKSQSLLWLPAVLVLTVFLISCLLSPLTLAVYFWFRYFLYVSLFLYLSRQSWSNEKVYRLLLITGLSTLVEGILAFVQWIKQGPIFPFLIFGEPSFYPSYSQTPLVSLFGNVKVRSFGSFPHPNVLGGFMAVFLIWLIWLWRREQSRKIRLFLFICMLFGFLGLMLSFSEGAWGAFLLGLFVFYILNFFQRSKRFLTIGGIFMFSLIISFFTITKLPIEPVNHIRSDLIKESLILWQKRPIFGFGLGSFTYFSGYLIREPVHNIFLLILSETGVVGLIAFSLLLILVGINIFIRRTPWHRLLLISLIQLIFLGTFDHYLLTYQQGSLFFWLILGLAASK